MGIGEEVSILPDGTPQHDPAPNLLARVVPRGPGDKHVCARLSINADFHLPVPDKTLHPPTLWANS